MKPKFIVFKIIVGSLLLVGISGCFEKPDNHPDVFSGYIEGRHVFLSAPQAGWIEQLNVQEGDTVSPQQRIIQLDTRQQDILIQQAEAGVASQQAQLNDKLKGARDEDLRIIENRISSQQARLTLAASEKQRWLKTAARDFSSKSQRDQAIANYDIAKANLKQLQAELKQAQLSARVDQISAAKQQVEQAQANLENMQWQRDKRTILSENRGTVDEIYYRNGEYVTPGQPILSILLKGENRVRFFVPQHRLTEFQLGSKVNVRVDTAVDHLQPDSQSTYPATIDYIAQQAEFTPPVIYSQDVRHKLVFLVEARLDDNVPLHPGQPVDVALP